MSLSSEACRRAVDLLLAARRDLKPIPALPEDCRPETAADGYAIQAALRDLRGGALAGFKIGATSQVAQTLLAWPADRGKLNGRGLEAGDLVTTGLVTPFTDAEAGAALRADYGPLGAVELLFLP